MEEDCDENDLDNRFRWSARAGCCQGVSEAAVPGAGNRQQTNTRAGNSSGRQTAEPHAASRDDARGRSSAALAATPDDPVWPLPKEAGDNFLDELVPNNLIATYHILESARQTGVKKVILASTGQVVWDQSFDGPYPIRVDAKPTPRWWYASTKVFLESIGEAYAKQGFFSVIAIRLGFCPRDKGHVELIASNGTRRSGCLSQPERCRPVL